MWIMVVVLGRRHAAIFMKEVLYIFKLVRERGTQSYLSHK